jgi:hypothetical protein
MPIFSQHHAKVLPPVPMLGWHPSTDLLLTAMEVTALFSLAKK